MDEGLWLCSCIVLSFISQLLSQYTDSIFWKYGIMGDDRHCKRKGTGNNHSITWIIVNLWKLDGADADVNIQGDNFKVVVLKDGLQPVLGRGRQFELAFLIVPTLCVGTLWDAPAS